MKKIKILVLSLGILFLSQLAQAMDCNYNNGVFDHNYIQYQTDDNNQPLKHPQYGFVPLMVNENKGYTVFVVCSVTGADTIVLKPHYGFHKRLDDNYGIMWVYSTSKIFKSKKTDRLDLTPIAINPQSITYSFHNGILPLKFLEGERAKVSIKYYGTSFDNIEFPLTGLSESIKIIQARLNK